MDTSTYPNSETIAVTSSPDTWKDDKGRDLTSAFLGITSPPRELLNEIHKRGWTVQNVDWKSDSYVATAKNPHGEKQEGTGNSDATALAHLLSRIMRQEYMRSSAQRKVGMWDSNWTDDLETIAQAYAEAPIYDPKAASAWVELARDSLARLQTLQQQLHIEIVDDPQPYKSPQEMCEDVQQKQHLSVSRANTDHPVWTVEEALAFRAVHDVLGHCVSGGLFGWQGENAACQAHMPLLTPLAQKALFTECIGQTAYGQYYRTLGPQKIAFLDDHMEDVQEKENAPGHTGINPTQSIAPAFIPQTAPEQVTAHRIANESLGDPNEGWESGVEPLPDNAYLWHGDPLDSQGALDKARGLDTGWHRLTHPDGTPDSDSMKQAVVNSFRGALLSPRKSPKWNAVHYQDIMHLPASVSDPQRYHDTLENRREIWNQAQGMAPGAHKPYWAELQAFRQYIKGINPGLTDEEVHQKADQEFLHIRNEEEERLLSEDKGDRLDANAIEQQVAKTLKKRLKLITKPKLDPNHDHDSDRIFLDAGVDQEQYGSWLGSHLKSIGQVSRYSDDLLKAAQKDIQDHDGTGHHFRKETLGLGIPGVDPKLVSTAWNLLQPQTSQLAAIDPHIMETLGRDYDNEMTKRDFFRYERELAAGRDAAGYGHVPLGQFGQAMKDFRHLGPGAHQDNSGMRVLDPIPHANVEGSIVPSDEWISPPWWEATAPIREQVGQDFDRNVAKDFPEDAIPFQQRTPMAHTAANERSPYFTHPDTGEQHIGAPGISLMQHIKDTMGLDTAGVWSGEWGDLGKR